MSSRFTIVALLVLPFIVHGSVRPHQELRDIFYGEILYHAYQDDYFEAISHLDTELGQYKALDEPALDSFHWHRGQAEFAVGDLELYYRMHQRAGRAIEAVLADNVSESERNEAAFRLARLYYRKQDYINALHSIELIKGEVPEKFRSDETFLRAQIYVSVGKFSDAIKLLKDLKGEKSYRGYIEYNLAMAYLQNAQTDQAVAMLDELGRVSTDDEAVLALKDKGNLKLATYYVDKGDAASAAKYYSRIRLDGPFSNSALLGAGWVEVAQDRFDRALVHWTLLHDREQTNLAVQEAMMAVPFAYSKLDVHGKAAIMYGRAMDVFASEIDSLDASIKSIREGKFLAALLDKKAEQDKNWVVNLRQLPDSPETRYIMELLAAHDFQESLKNYKDLAELDQHLTTWLDSLPVYEDIIELRRRYYEPLLPKIEKEFKKIDSRMRLRIEQRDRLNERIQSLLVLRRPEYLATADERAAMDLLAKMKVDLEANPQLATEEILYRMERLSGVLDWRINLEFDERLTEAYRNLKDLDGVIDDLNKQYRAFVRTRQAATQSYEGYTIPIQRLRTHLNQTQQKLERIMARQGKVLEQMAINELELRRSRLEEYQIKARFALAESYDRATKQQEKKMLEEAAAAVSSVANEKAAP
ncbi:MAG: tetratricopeptide repeat protein [Thiotrichales bacterium]|nr:MAG: tetratricopeptide repeat protein [Thiotrichales bacterium]